MAVALVVGCQGEIRTPLPTAEPPTESAPTQTQPVPTSSAAPTPASGAIEAHWEPAGTATSINSDTIAVLLGDGRVLLLEGRAVRDPGSGAWRLGTEVSEPATGTWRTTGSLESSRIDFAAAPLSDGRVLVTGGFNDTEQSYSSAYVYDPRSGFETWSKAGLMETARAAPISAVLPDGRVLVAGGYFRHAPTEGRNPTGDPVLAAYRPAPGRETASAGSPVADAPPANVGAALATAELFDPVTDSWSATGPLNYARFGAAAVTLGDGRVLVVGSRGFEAGVTVDPGAFDTAEVYDPKTERFSLVGELPDIDRSAVDALGVRLPEGNPLPADNGILLALNDGGALLVANGGWWKHEAEISRSFRFDPHSGAWREAGQPFAISWDNATGQASETPGEPRWHAQVALLLDGRVLIAGGDGAIQEGSVTRRSAELYDPTTATWSAAPDMPEGRAGGWAVALMDGSALVVGGYNQALPCGGPPDPYCGEPGTEIVNLASAFRFVLSP